MKEANKGWIDGLDGLRALSVLAVFLSHTGLAGIEGGFIGVDVFFVLSGFLITRLLSAEHARDGQISFRGFYWRRARRLYPALFGVLAAVAVYTFFYEPALRGSLEVFPALFYVMNWVRAFQGYDAVLTGHTWSLAIEEQFYLLWPCLLLVLLRLGYRRSLAGMVALAVVIFAWREWLAFHHTPLARIYCGFDTHSDGLIYGAILSSLNREHIRRIGYLWPLGAVYLGVTLFDLKMVHFAVRPIGYVPTSIAAVVVIARVVTAQTSVLVRVLDVWPLAMLGRVSYGFYLWHYPVIHVMLYGGHDPILGFFGSFAFPKPVMISATFAVSLAFTLLSWFVIEKPTMRLRFPRRSVSIA
ncbi:acyltransferase (plasmid) [Caballeronia sp. NK8]|uniref:acyltransferase family protein n=1 Tax=Caballeronia sp. NK8 TaxID=140098 RepID=UPI001BB726E9|nr:acyltransferase [Caballeronia sp. NK8]BCQ27695.1 acyltransferase [Caballeronia sp. NK8]